MQRSTPPYASEIILYRTRSDILSDLRFIVDGTTYPLSKIQSARVSMLWYYLPLQLVRLLTLIAAAAILGHTFGVVKIDPLPDSMLITLVGIAGLLTFALPISQMIPTHVIRLKLDAGQVKVMSSSDVRHLKEVAEKINQATIKVRQGKVTT
ncbi:MAG: hypothetical protein HY866_21205 [Chloroflexi bacterium]|nr:hypothetical protein [Chloroflexota bacterium]